MTKLKLKNKYNGERIPDQTDVKISIDTFNLVAKLTQDQQEELFYRIAFMQKTWYQDRYFKFSMQITNDIIIKFSPRNPLTWITYNTMLIFTKNTSSTFIPYSVLEILQFETWQIKRLDIAFDFSNGTPFSSFPNRLIMKSHGNVKILQQSKHEKDWESDYVGTFKSRNEAKACCYDRNKKEGIDQEYPLRFEVRLFPKLNEYNFLKRIDHGWIEKKLSKFIFLADIEQLPLNRWDKNRLYKIQADYDYLKEIKAPKQKEIKHVATEHRVPFEDIYANNKNKLFSFLELYPLYKAESLQVFEQLTLEEVL